MSNLLSSPTKLTFSNNSLFVCSFDQDVLNGLLNSESLKNPFDLSNTPFSSFTPSAAPTTPTQDSKLFPCLFDNNSINFFNIPPLPQFNLNTNSLLGLIAEDSSFIKKEHNESEQTAPSHPPIFSLLSESPPLSLESSNPPSFRPSTHAIVSESSSASPPLPSSLTPCSSPLAFANTNVNLRVKEDVDVEKENKPPKETKKRKSDKASPSSSSDPKKSRKQKSHIITNLPAAKSVLEKCGWDDEEIQAAEEWVLSNPQVFYSRSWRHKIVQFLATNDVFQRHVRWVNETVMYVDNHFRAALDGLFQMNNARPESLTWIRSVFTVFTAEKPNEWTVLSNMKPYFNRSISIEDIENTARGRRRLTPLEKSDE
eukprot:TRINITY_DN6855_c0_g3_i1.p1 TRINITY_DN6855_c0_g3~~TRINITY_DN6855_c0_g3_i1.p1  ORF type:complete len:370 (+),score=75.88 TRINITY_DN6855_c0_g3_i1:212-1321(+)